jgi:formate/nitrite transporter FocA (FNT family)
MTLFVYINYLVTVIFTSSLPASKLKGAAVIAPLVPSFGLLLIVCCKQ